MGGYALGYYTPPLAPGEGPESVPPEYALGHTETAISTLGSADLLKSIRDEIKGEKQTAQAASASALPCPVLSCQTSRLCSTVASTKERNRGCGSNGFDFSSG